MSDPSRHGIMMRERMLPDSDDRPSFSPQAPGDPAVSRSVPRYLLAPEFLIEARGVVADRAPMPEAPVNKYANARTPKDEVRCAVKRLMSSPTGYPVSAEEARKGDLG
jgi:hypothetical protein